MCVDFYVPHVTFDGKPERHSAASRKGGGGSPPASRMQSAPQEIGAGRNTEDKH